MALRVQAYVHRFFRWCVGRDIIEANPAADLPKAVLLPQCFDGPDRPHHSKCDGLDSVPPLLPPTRYNWCNALLI